MQFSTAIRNVWLDAIESEIGESAKLEIRTGPPPASCVAAETGTLLASLTLPADWMNAASGGSKSKLGTWQTISLVTGSPGHFRIYDSAGLVCGLQGTASETGEGGDMEIYIYPVVGGFNFAVTEFTLTAPGD